MAIQTGDPILHGISISGATLPTGTYAGQQYLHTPTGRKWLCEFDGTSWYSIRALGSSVIYVSKTGTDDQNKGTAGGTDAFLTIQYAWNQVPPVSDAYIYVYVEAGTYTENLWFTGKTFGHGGSGNSIKFIGSLTDVTDAAHGTATGGTNASGAVHAQVTGTFAADFQDAGATPYTGKLIKFTSGSNNNVYRVIGQTTATTLWLDGEALPAQPANEDTYVIYDWATIIDGSGTVANTGCVRFENIATTFDSTNCVLTAWGGSMIYFTNSFLTQAGAYYGIWVGGGGGFIAEHSYFYQSSGTALIEAEYSGYFEGQGIKLKGNGTGTYGAYANKGGYIDIYYGSEISGFPFGAVASQGCITLSGAVPTTYIHGCATQGVRSENNGNVRVSSGVTYAKLIDNATADANGANENAGAWTGIVS